MGGNVILGPAAIPDGSVTLAKHADLASAGLLGRTSAGAVEIVSAADVQEFITPTPVLTLGAAGSNNTHTVNVTTLGDIDWLCCGTNTNIPRIINSPIAKKTGPGWLANGFDFVYGSASPTLATQNSTWRTITMTPSDGLALSSYNTVSAVGLNTPGANTGWGIRFAIPAPADGIQRVLRIYGCQFSSIVTHSAFLTDGSISAPANVTTDSTISTQLDFLTTVTYKAKYGGAYLIVTCLATTNRSAGASVRIQGASIGTA